jgi:hypothetical protein
VEVKGTHFRVDVDDGRTRVSVENGVVQVTARDETRAVRAGEAWDSNAAPPPPPPPAAPKPPIAQEPPSVPTVRAAPEPPIASSPASAPTPAVSSAAKTSRSPREQFDLAQSLERSDPGRAVQLYDELARTGGPWSGNALFAEARLQADRGERDSAKQLLDEYLRRYPDGPNVADANALLTRLGP